MQLEGSSGPAALENWTLFLRDLVSLAACSVSVPSEGYRKLDLGLLPYSVFEWFDIVRTSVH